MLQSLISLIIIFSILLFTQGNTFIVDPAKNAVFHNEKGVYFLKYGFYGAAIREFQLAILLNPESQASASFYNNLGKTYYKLNAYDYALPHYQKAIILNPNFLEYYQNLVDLFKVTKSLDNAIKKYENLIEREEHNSYTYLTLGILYKEKNNKVGAINNLSRFRRLQPDLHVTRQVEVMIKELSRIE